MARNLNTASIKHALNAYQRIKMQKPQHTSVFPKANAQKTQCTSLACRWIALDPRMRKHWRAKTWVALEPTMHPQETKALDLLVPLPEHNWHKHWPVIDTMLNTTTHALKKLQLPTCWVLCARPILKSCMDDIQGCASELGFPPLPYLHLPSAAQLALHWAFSNLPDQVDRYMALAENDSAACPTKNCFAQTARCWCFNSAVFLPLQSWALNRALQLLQMVSEGMNTSKIKPLEPGKSNTTTHALKKLQLPTCWVLCARPILKSCMDDIQGCASELGFPPLPYLHLPSAAQLALHWAFSNLPDQVDRYMALAENDSAACPTKNCFAQTARCWCFNSAVFLPLQSWALNRALQLLQMISEGMNTSKIKPLEPGKIANTGTQDCD